MTVRLMESLRPQYPELQNDIQPSWPVEHMPIPPESVFPDDDDDDSKADSPDTIYTLQQSALQYSLLFLPKTIRTILVTPYLIHGDHIIQHNRLLHTNHEFVNHFPVNLNTTATTHNNNSSIINPNRNALKHLDSLIKISASSASSTIDQVIDRTVNWLTQTVPCHLFQTITPRVDPLNSDIPIWLVVCQRLFQDDSIFQSSINWTYLALKWLEKANSDDNTNANTNNSITTSECCLNCFREWYRYAPDNATSVALLIAGLIHPV
ncbi:unnamed protein product [Trichobilharzia regenti]|nr:unnamed protein product [Trichobilharzia regenti]